MDTSKYVMFTRFKEEIKNDVMLKNLIPQIDLIAERYGAEYLEIAEDILTIMEKMGYDSFAVCKVFNFDYMYQMAQFLETGEYGHDDYEQIKEDIYFNEEVMMDTYMPGLFLAYSNGIYLHVKTNLFLNKFVPQLKEGHKGLEIGYGEGFYLWQLIKHAPFVDVKGYDISKWALKFADKMLDLSGVKRDMLSLDIGDVTQGLALDDNTMDFGIIAEVIEHLSEPVVGIKELARVLKPGGIMYLTTVIDTNHMDHVSNFESPEEIVSLIKSCDFSVTDELIYVIKDDFPSSNDVSKVLAYVCKKQ